MKSKQSALKLAEEGGKAPGRIIPDDSRLAGGQCSSPDKPSTFELAHLAATLATSAAETAPPKLLVSRAKEIWQAAADLNASETTRKLILATLPKMRDGDNHLKIERKASDRTKGPPLITEERWNSLLSSYGGHGPELAVEISRVFIPTAEILAEVFPNPRIAREKQLGELISEVARRKLFCDAYSYARRLCGLLGAKFENVLNDAGRFPLPFSGIEGVPKSPKNVLIYESTLYTRLPSAMSEPPAVNGVGWLKGDYRSAWFCRWLIVAKQRLLSETSAAKARKGCDAQN